MPGRFFIDRSFDEIAYALGVEVGVAQNEMPNLDIEPGSEIVTCEESRKLVKMRWGIVPVGRVNARGRPELKTIINARSETVFDKSVYQGMRRCVVPVDGWYEWTGETRKKTRWRIRAKSGGILIFAAIYDIWKGPGGIEVPQVATLTCEPNKTVRDIHHRMGVILQPDLMKKWLNGEDIPFEPAPDDLLVVEDASAMDA